MCCNLLVPIIAFIAFIAIRAILSLPTDPSSKELMDIQRRKAELRRKAGLNRFKL